MWYRGSIQSALSKYKKAYGGFFVSLNYEFREIFVFWDISFISKKQTFQHEKREVIKG